ncbi:MAG: DUF4091 domain-containing protein [Clostridia bacterium]|nr:DUF4091 domain-containing protein [Clostridia bacterium]
MIKNDRNRKNRICLALIFAALLLAACITACSHGTNDPGTGTAEGTDKPVESTTPEAVTTEEELTPAVISGWFDYGSALYKRDRFEPGTASSIEIQMAKNEVEGFQYLVTSDRNVKGLRCDLSEMKDETGNKLPGTVNVVWYTWVNQSDNLHDTFTWYPVGMLPMDDEYQGGSFDVEAGTCRTVYVSFRTDKDTVPGTYTGTLTLSRKGETLLSGDVSVRVRDVYYEEKTECLTMMGLGYDKEDTNAAVPAGPESAPALGSQQASGKYSNPDLYLEYAEFLLDNRFSMSWLPLQLDLFDDSAVVKKLMNNPRLTSVNIRGRGEALAKKYKLASENGWLDKCYFAYFDEPTTEAHLQGIMGNAREVNQYFPTTHFLDAFGVNISAGGRNVVERMSDYTTVYCPVINVFRGELRESMLRLKAERGDTLFWYTCGSGKQADVNAINCLPCTPGTDKRLMFWMQYQQNVDGFLYWATTFWNFSYDVWAEDYMDTKFPFPRSDGMPTDDGVLIYWHPVTKKPVTTLGFEAMRDGVEDFQLFKMAERKLGREKVLEYIEQLVTDINQFKKVSEGSTELLMDLRNQIFDLVEG